MLVENPVIVAAAAKVGDIVTAKALLVAPGVTEKVSEAGEKSRPDPPPVVISSRAFAVADHQVAHVYVKERNRLDEVAAEW